LLERATFKKLHTPPRGGDYAGGWIVVERGWAGGRALNHDGSNTMWYASTWLAPARDFATVAVTNLGGGPTAEACDEIHQGLISLAAQSGPRRTPPRR
jgi:hypothetical protein